MPVKYCLCALFVTLSVFAAGCSHDKGAAPSKNTFSEVSVVYNPALLPKIPPAALDAAKSAEQEIIAGKVNVTKLASTSPWQRSSRVITRDAPNRSDARLEPMPK